MKSLIEKGYVKRMTVNQPQVNNNISNNNKYNNYKKKGSFHNFHEREALEYERQFLVKKSKNLNMSFPDFVLS